MNEISIYETPGGSIEVRLERETVWLSQEQMATLFDVQKAAVSKHLKNIFASGELEREPTVSKMETVRITGSIQLTGLSDGSIRDTRFARALTRSTHRAQSSRRNQCL